MMQRPPSSTSTDTPFPYTPRCRSCCRGGGRDGCARQCKREGQDAQDHRRQPSCRGRWSRQGRTLGAEMDGLPAVRLHRARWRRHGREGGGGRGGAGRSEEHTSELQSLMRISYAVFCLKKKKPIKITKNKKSTPSAYNTH